MDERIAFPALLFGIVTFSYGFMHLTALAASSGWF